jgi:hypothetical protein
MLKRLNDQTLKRLNDYYSVLASSIGASTGASAGASSALTSSLGSSFTTSQDCFASLAITSVDSFFAISLKTQANDCNG